MRKVLILLCAVIVAGIGIACSDSPSTTTTIESGSPMEAYRNLFNAVKSKDTEAIKALMSKGSIGLIQMQAQQTKSPIEKVYENGLTATTFSEVLPEMRDERISGDFAAVEVWNSRDSRWEDLPFIREDGTWKLALGDAFSGKFRSPGPGRSMKEAMAANAVNNEMIRIDPANVNSAAAFNADPNADTTGARTPANAAR